MSPCIENLCWNAIERDSLPPNCQLKLGTEEISYEVAMTFYSIFIMQFDYTEFIRGTRKNWELPEMIIFG